MRVDIVYIWDLLSIAPFSVNIALIFLKNQFSSFFIHVFGIELMPSLVSRAPGSFDFSLANYCTVSSGQTSSGMDHDIS